MLISKCQNSITRLTIHVQLSLNIRHKSFGTGSHTWTMSLHTHFYDNLWMSDLRICWSALTILSNATGFFFCSAFWVYIWNKYPGVEINRIRSALLPQATRCPLSEHKTTCFWIYHYIDVFCVRGDRGHPVARGSSLFFVQKSWLHICIRIFWLHIKLK